MKILNIVTLFTLVVIAKGTFLAAAVRPLIMTFGAAFAALDLDVIPSLDINLIDMEKWLKKNPLPVTKEVEK